ncbi:DDE-type integrase/transposase/recombinase [Campylobacter sp. RM16188]|uniref:Mu transposase C-terminal domain-containing protein n=1 Tax=Campylobacter sp. RM16188 TaxID=1705725 RepID=UPI00155747B5|nr:DDE-type integrase/transposase/recombinase [Campylobacter sp. RM16188]
MWVNSKEAAEILGVKYDALQKATRRAEKCGKKICSIKFHKLYFSYIEGRGGASGKILQIWIDDEIIKQSKSNINEKEGFNGEIIEKSANAERDACFEEFRREIQPADVHALKDSESVKAISAATESIGSLNFMKKEGKNANGSDREDTSCKAASGTKPSSRIGADDAKRGSINSGGSSEAVKIPAFCKEYEQKGLCGQDSRSRGVWMESERSLDGHTIHNLYDDNSASGNLLLNEAKYKGENIDETDKKNVVNICSHSDTISDNMCSTDSKGELWDPKVRGVVWQTGRMGGEIDNDDSDGFVSSGNDSGNHAVVYASNNVDSKFASASDRKKELALVKKMILDEWTRAKGRVREASFIEYINAKRIYPIKLTANKLYAWQRAYKNGGIDGLIDERTNNKECEITKLGLEDITIRLIYSQRGRINSYNIYKMLNYHAVSEDLISHDDFLGKKDEIVSYEVVNRFVKNHLKSNPILKTLIEKGEDGAISKHLTALGRSNWAADSINQIVEIDASPLDVICNASDLCKKIGFEAVNNVFKDREEFESFVSEWQKRYTIIGLIDTYSGVASFHVSDTENSTAIARATAKYILRYGKPATIKGDNGKAFKSKANFSFLGSVGIEYKAVRAYSGWLKPYVEKNFGALQNGLSEWLMGFIGHDISQRQAIEFFFSKKERRLKKGYLTNLKELNTIDEISSLIDDYAEKFLNNRYLERLGKTCREAYNEKSSEAITMSELELSLYLAQKESKKVLKKGISVDGVWFSNLAMFNHSQVLVRANLNNIKEQFVFDEKDKFIGVATPLDLQNGESVETAKAAQKIITQRIKKIKDKSAADRKETEKFFEEYVRNVEASKANKPEIKSVNKEIENRMKLDRNMKSNAELSDEYMQYAAKSQSKPKIKGFEEMAEAKRKAI